MYIYFFSMVFKDGPYSQIELKEKKMKEIQNAINLELNDKIKYASLLIIIVVCTAIVLYCMCILYIVHFKVHVYNTHSLIIFLSYSISIYTIQVYSAIYSTVYIIYQFLLLKIILIFIENHR